MMQVITTCCKVDLSLTHLVDHLRYHAVRRQIRNLQLPVEQTSMIHFTHYQHMWQASSPALCYIGSSASWEDAVQSKAFRRSETSPISACTESQVADTTCCH
jgi:hypothetical protein